MEKAEIKAIADYLKDLEEGLYEWDYRGITTQGHLTELYRIIKRIPVGQMTSRNHDFELKNGFGFCLQGFISGARYEPTTLLSKSLDNTAFFFLCILDIYQEQTN